MGNEPDIPIGKNLFTVEKVSKDETITINVVVNAKAQVKLSELKKKVHLFFYQLIKILAFLEKLTAEEIERFTTKLRQTKITSFFQNTRLENSTVFPDQYAQEVDYQNLSVPSTIPESSDYQVPKKLPRIESRGNFARKRTNPIYAHVQDSDAKLQRFFKENVEQEPIRLDKIKAPRKRSEDSDYGSLSCKSIKVEEDSNTYCGVIQSTELQNRIFKNELGQKISTPLNPETPNGRKVDEIIAYCVKDNDILFEVTWKNSEDISWVSLENLKDSRKLENYMEFLYITKHTCMNNYFNKVSNLTPEQIQEAFQGQSKNILKELETFDINEYKRSILLGMLLDDGTREPNNVS